MSSARRFFPGMPRGFTVSKIYFITGAQGCIGSWIVKALVERGDVAVVFDRSDNSSRLRAIMDADDLARVRFITGDITEGAAVLSALSASGAERVIRSEERRVGKEWRTGWWA